MQKWKYYDKPSPHIIIDDFLTTRLARACLKEAIELEPHYEQAQVRLEQRKGVTTQDRQYARKAFRDNDIIYLDQYFKGRRKDSILISAIVRASRDQVFIEAMKKYPSIFPILSRTNETELILSRYGMCDFYGWHTDTSGLSPTNNIGRIITLVYWFNKEPSKFEGGDLLYSDGTVNNYINVEPKHNRALIFPSDILHAVDDVRLEGGFDEGRFSINCWLGFKSRLEVDKIPVAGNAGDLARIEEQRGGLGINVKRDDGIQSDGFTLQ